MSEAYGINLVEYDASSGHQVVADSLLELADVVEVERPHVRHLSDLVRQVGTEQVDHLR